MLAGSLPTVSRDGLTYTIKLRQGVMFHNGKEMTSEDVVASLKRWASRPCTAGCCSPRRPTSGPWTSTRSSYGSRSARRWS